jgi:MoxR-like ATPase
MRFFFIDDSDRQLQDPAQFVRSEVPRRAHDLSAGAAGYVVDRDLVDTINVALALGAPLLLTGAPGTGKTQLAHWLVYKLSAGAPALHPELTETPIDNKPEAWEQPFTLHTRSTTTWRDLLYSFDTVRYFHDGMDRTRSERGQPPIRPQDYVTPGPLWRAFAAMKEGVPAVVLIDEIDKAPRDFPNDLLHELDQYSFRVPELADRRIDRPDGARPPVLIITSNDERKLPGPFLRRCVVHHLKLDDKVLRKAALRRKPTDFPDLPDPLIDEAIGLLLRLQSDRLSRKPATAELISWLTALGALKVTVLDRARLPALGALLKDEEDRKLAGQLLG